MRSSTRARLALCFAVSVCQSHAFEAWRLSKTFVVADPLGVAFEAWRAAKTFVVTEQQPG